MRNKDTEKIIVKIRAIKVPLYVNPGPDELRDLWIEAKSKNLGDPNHNKFMIDGDENLYVWSGDRGLYRYVVKNLGMSLRDFKAFGVFRTELRDPRKLDSLEYISKNSFMTVTNDILKRRFMKIIHRLRLRKSPGFQDFAQRKDEES